MLRRLRNHFVFLQSSVSQLMGLSMDRDLMDLADGNPNSTSRFFFRFDFAELPLDGDVDVE